MSILIVDGNNLVCRMTSVYVKAKDSHGRYTGGLFGSLKAIRDHVAKFGHDSVYFTVDQGIPEYKRKLAPEYKAQRAAQRNGSPEAELTYRAYRAQMDYIHEVLIPAGISVVSAPGWEGDDVIAALVLIKHIGEKITILSSDKDFTPLVDKHVNFYDALHSCNVSPCATYTLEKSIRPKRSDNLGGIPGVGEKTAEMVVEEYVKWLTKSQPSTPTVESAPSGEHSRDVSSIFNIKTEIQIDSFEEWLSHAIIKEKNGPKKLTFQKVKDFFWQVRKNYAVTHLPTAAERCFPHLRIQPGQPDQKLFFQRCRDYNLAPILEDMSAIWPCFSRLSNP